MLSVIVANGVDENLFLRGVYSDQIEIICVESDSLSKAFNDGLTRSNGDFVWFVEHNDLIENDVLKKILPIVRETTSDVLFFDYNLLYFDGYIECNHANIYCAQGNQFIPAILTGNVAPLLCNKIFRKHTLISNGLRFDESMSVYFDNLFLLKLYSCSQIVTSYHNFVLINHQTQGSHLGYLKPNFFVSKIEFEEFPRYIMLARLLLDESYYHLLERIEFRFKLLFYDNQYLKKRTFNSILPTPIKYFWNPTFSLLDRIKFTIAFILNKFGIN